MKQYSDEIQRLLKEVVTHFDKEDVSVRERQIRTWRRLKLFWENFQRAWYSEVAHDWRIYDESQGDDSDQSYYDKPINVFRAYLESIIAALSVVVPPIKCYPDDADNTLDLSTARAGDKISQLVYRHNNVSLLWLHALFIYCTEGMVACHNYPKSDNKFGTYEKKEYDEIEQMTQVAMCPNCQYELSNTPVTPDAVNQAASDIEFEPDAFQPEQVEMDLCPSCGSQMMPQIEQKSFTTTRLVGVTKEAKTRVMLDCFGGLYVKVANYARKQDDTPYLIWAYETHYANTIERFEHLHGNKNLLKKIPTEVGPKDPYEQWGRLSPQYQGEYPQNTVTVRNAWLRPAAFNVLQDKKDVDTLKKKFPRGAKVVLVNDEFGEACEQSLDDYWTLTYNPLSDYIHHDPLGLLLISISEITNDLVSLTLQTIEHGIGQTFADPSVLDFNAYRQLEALPGGIFEAKPKSGQSLAEAFHEVKTATLSHEVLPFGNYIQTLGQMVSGALPSLFGGQLEGSETASEYSMSRAQAMQRVQNIWKIFTTFWKEIFGKVIPQSINEIKEDERDVDRDKNGNFFNVFIKKAELEGRIGRVELEASENLPITWQQKKDVLMQLLQGGNPEILQILGAPENLPVIRESIGLTDFFVPGEDDKDKQYDEIKLLLNSGPMPTGDEMMPELPSVEIEPEFDDHDIHFEIVRKWVISDAGRQTKMDNESGYRNVILHGLAHYAQIQMVMQQQALAGPKGAAPGEKPNPNASKEAPIAGEENVQTQ